MSKEFIRIGGAREHNLKDLTLDIPRDRLVVITGLISLWHLPFDAFPDTTSVIVQVNTVPAGYAAECDPLYMIRFWPFQRRPDDLIS